MVPPPPPTSSSQSRSGTFSPPQQPLQTGGLAHSPHPSQSGPLSAGASPSASSPTSGSSSVSKIVIAQVYLLLSTIKEDKDRAKWELQADQLKKLIDDHGMEVFSKYFTRLVAGNAPQIFPGLNRPVANPGNYSLLAGEMSKISRDLDQATKIAEAIETANEDIFRDFDLSTFMEHFKLDALDKTILALAFKFGSRSDLKTKADAILSTNFPTFVNIISRPDLPEHSDLTPAFIAAIVDRYIQGHPPNFNAPTKSELSHKVKSRWLTSDQAPPLQVLAALDLLRVLGEKSPNALALYIQRTGSDFTRDEETCFGYLQNRPANILFTEEQVSNALTYTTISLTPTYNPSILVAALRRVLPQGFSWQDVISYFDQRDVRVSSEQFLALYKALLTVAQGEVSLPFDIQYLWGGTHWENPETQLAFICAFASLSPDQLDASTIPGLQPTFALDEYANSPPDVRERAAFASRHPLVSKEALSAIFQVALHSLHASQSIEAKRLFQEVVVPNLDIFIVSAFGVSKPWPPMAVETLGSLFDNFLYRRSEYPEFVMDSLWRKDKDWVIQRLIDAHAAKPIDLPLIFEHVIKHNWLEDLVYLPIGFGFDLAALAHAEGYLDLQEWANSNAMRGTDISRNLLQFLTIKARIEADFQKSTEDPPPQKTTTSLQVKTVSAMLGILEDFMPKAPVQDLILVQRLCISAYPRLINYGEGYDEITDANGINGNAIPVAATERMEEHFKKMYSDEADVKDIVETLSRYKHSRAPLDQDVFACMIQGLFDEYSHYEGYPLEALATTAVLFGGIISHKLISDLPLKIGLGMILEAVRDHTPDESMYKFGLQALMQLFSRFREWPGFCKQLVQIPGLQGTEAWRKAEEVVREHDEELGHPRNGAAAPAGFLGGESAMNGNVDEPSTAEAHAPPFASINVEPSPPGMMFEEPEDEVQDRIQFGLNNLTRTTLQHTYQELHDLLEQRHQQWFASHLVEERAKMQPNFHDVYLSLVKLFEDPALWSEILRQTYMSVSRMLNAESTMQNSTERTHLKHLGLWLGLLTIARDRPIKFRNIAFKQLLLEAHDTKRLIVVIPFVCKVLCQSKHSTMFRPPNPWLMDILQLLVALYKHAELKLNLKFEIEVLCKDLDLDHQSIEPSEEILNRAPVEEIGEIPPMVDTLEPFENLSLNGIAPGVSAALSPHAPPISVPDLDNLVIPPTNEMVVSAARLHDIVRTAVSRALGDIIQPVVDRSVTIAAISTQQMIHKDFATEPDENKIRTAAINMVKATAGSLALVTSKEPLRANITNYMRQLSNDLPQGLPEGTIIMCVNSNLDIACSHIEKQAAERAVPEIEDMIQPELEQRRQHRLQRPNEPFVDQSVLNRWAMTIPHPYKISPSMSGLNAEQLAIYEDFARQPRAGPPSAQAHASSASDATRNIANEVLQDQYSSVPNLPTPAETPSLPHVNAQLPYPHGHAGMTNGRPPTHTGQVDGRVLLERLQKMLAELQRAATESREEHFSELPRPHPVLDMVDACTQLIIKTSQSSHEFAFYAADRICQLLFSQIEHTLFLESLVHILELLLKISASSGAPLHERVVMSFQQQPPQNLLNLPLISILMRTDLLDLQLLDLAMSKMLANKEENSLSFFERLLDLLLLNDRPVALFADFVRSLELAWEWTREEPDNEVGQHLKAKLLGSGLPKPSENAEEYSAYRQDQFEYVFEEWIRLFSNPNATEKSQAAFVKQLRGSGLFTSKDDFIVFLRTAIDMSVGLCEAAVHTGGASQDNFNATDALVRLIALCAKGDEDESGETQGDPTPTLKAVLALASIVLNHHYVTRGVHFNQRVFFRFFSMLLHSLDFIFEERPEAERQAILLPFVETLLQLGPARFPGFSFAWLSLIEHRQLLPELMMTEDKRGWSAYNNIVMSLLRYVGENMNLLEMVDAFKEFYRGAVKFLVILQHDFPDYMAANHVRFCNSLPPHCIQLRNIILIASPRQDAGANDSARPQGSVPGGDDKPEEYLKEAGLLEIVDQLLQNGPSEDAIANLTLAISKSSTPSTTFGNVPLNTNLQLIDAVVLYIGNFAVARAQADGSPFIPGAPDIATLSFLVHELQPEPRYFLLCSIINQLRYASLFTNYFSQVVFDIFGHDFNDPEESDIRQQLVRVLLERFTGFWPQPWGLIGTIIELTKNEKYMFFEQPFIKADREIAAQFAAIMNPA